MTREVCTCADWGI